MQDIEDERARPPRRERAEHLQLATLYRAEFASRAVIRRGKLSILPLNSARRGQSDQIGPVRMDA